MKTNKKHFSLFKAECQKWIDNLELNNWKVYFKHKGYISDRIIADDITID